MFSVWPSRWAPAESGGDALTADFAVTHPKLLTFLTFERREEVFTGIVSLSMADFQDLKDDSFAWLHE